MTQKRLPKVKTTLAVASGKGGVGKSTVSVNLAIALNKIGLKVGLLDADIYGPSQHIMLGLKDQTPVMGQDKKIQPVEKFGIKLMTFGFFVKPEEAVVWRGPMIGRMITQFIDDVLWDELDVLVIDMPPGTGDAQLTITQSLPITGSVVVSTPQDIALADAIKGINMFQKVNVPVVGLIENMSYFQCPSCDHKSHIFSSAGAKLHAQEKDVPFLGELPLEEATRVGGDQGKPIVAKNPDSEQSKRFIEMAKTTWDNLQKAAKENTGPTVNINLGAPKPAAQSFDV